MDNIKKTKINAYFTLSGENFCTDYVTAETGIIPTNVRHHNERLNNGQLFGHTEWGIETGWLEVPTLEEALFKIMQIINEKKATFARIARLFKAQWGLLIVLEVWDEEQPSLYFPQEIIKILGELGGDIGIDYYYYYNNLKICEAISDVFDN